MRLDSALAMILYVSFKKSLLSEEVIARDLPPPPPPPNSVFSHSVHHRVTIIFGSYACKSNAGSCSNEYWNILLDVVLTCRATPLHRCVHVLYRVIDTHPFPPPPPPHTHTHTSVINACNASLRSDKFSGMATRTRKQYLIDLAENSTSSLTIDQANASGGLVGK